MYASGEAIPLSTERGEFDSRHGRYGSTLDHYAGLVDRVDGIHNREWGAALADGSTPWSGSELCSFMVIEVLMDTRWPVKPELRARYPSITPK